MRSVNILAMNKLPDSVRLSHNGIFGVKRNEASVSASDAMKSRLLTGVTGGMDLGSFLCQGCLRAFGTGRLQM